MLVPNMFFIHDEKVVNENTVCNGCEPGYPTRHEGCAANGHLHMEWADSGDEQGMYKRIRCSGCAYRRDIFS